MQYEHEIGYSKSRERRLAAQKPICKKLPPVDKSLWPMFDTYLRGRGLSDKIARRNIWYPAKIDDIPRVIITTTSMIPGNMFWQGRAMVETEKRYESPHGVSRGDAIPVVWPVSKATDKVFNVITEGPMDALAIAETGAAGIALMGLTPQDIVLDLVVQVCKGWETLLCLDEDATGEASALVLRLAEKGLSCKLIRAYPKKDLADMTLPERQALMKEALNA